MVARGGLHQGYPLPIPNMARALSPRGAHGGADCRGPLELFCPQRATRGGHFCQVEGAISAKCLHPAPPSG